jgi:hypothetical protein
MKPSAYISDGGILFKESPPDSILKLNPLYTSAEIQALHNLVIEQVVEIEGLAFDLEYARRTDKFRELTEWEIEECWGEATEMREHFCSQYFDFAQLILKKASEK